jgi:hypothetical protein
VPYAIVRTLQLLSELTPACPQCDLEDRQVEHREIEAFYKQHNFVGWAETSAKEGLMVEDSMK